MPPTAPPPAVCSAPSPRARGRLRLACLAPLGLVALVASMAPAAQAGDLTRFAELPNAPAKMRTLRPGGPIKVNGLEQRIPGAPANVRMLGRVVNESVSEGAMGPKYSYDVELVFTNYSEHAVSFALPPGQATFFDQRVTTDQCINTDTIGYPQNRARQAVTLARGESVTFVERIPDFASVCQGIKVRPTHVRLQYGAHVDECLRDFPGTLRSARRKQASGDYEGALSTLVGGHQAHGCTGREGERSRLREEAEALFLELKQQQEGAAQDARAAKARRDEALRYIQRGDDKMARDDLSGAIRDYQRALEIDPDTAAQSRLQRAEAALAARQQAEARKKVEMEEKRAEEVRQATLQRHLDRFDAALAAGDLDAARSALSAAQAAGLSASETSSRRQALQARASELQQAAAGDGGAGPGASASSTPEAAARGGGQARGGSGPGAADSGEWKELVLAARAAYKRADFDGAIALYHRALEAGGDAQLINHELRQAENLARQKAQHERMVAEQQRMAAHYQQQQQEAEERRRVQQQQRVEAQRRQAEAEAARIMAEYERNVANINAVEDFVTGRILAYANNTELRNLAKAARSLDTSLEDPAALLADYEAKVDTLRAYAKTKQQEFAAAMDELRQLTEQLLAEAEAEAQAAGQIAVLAFQASGHIAIKAQEKKQSRILREELETAFDGMRDDLIRDNRKGLKTAQVNEARSMSEVVQKWAGGVVGFYQCNIDQINSRYSYDHTGWANPDCRQPDAAPTAPPVSTAEDAVRLGTQKLARARKNGPVAKLWLETASVLADGAAELKRDYAPAWALKADITQDSIDKLAWYRRARDLNNGGWSSAYTQARSGFSSVFFSAIKDQKTAFIERASKAGVHWLAEGADGESPIMVAVDANDKKTVKTTFRVFDHDPVSEGGPLLHLAASRDLAGAVAGLLASKVPHAWKDEDGKTAYYIAVSTGSASVLPVLTEAASPDHLALMRLALKLAEVQTADKLGLLGLAKAIEDGDRTTAARLLRTNARLITLPKDDTDSFVSWAVRTGEADWLKLFLRNGAFVDDTNLAGDPLLFVALSSGQLETAEYLVSHGAAVDAQTTRSGESPLHAAVSVGPEWVDRLLAEQAIPDLADKKGRTPLHVAVAQDKPDIVPRLLEARADTALQDEEGATPVIVAAKKADRALLDLLLPVTVAIDVQDVQGQTLLHHVVAKKMAPTVDALIDRDARLDLADKGGNTPLHVALASCTRPLAHTLHDAGAPLAPGNRYGMKPIHLAARCGDSQIVEASLGDEISVNVATNSGRTPLHEAAAAGQTALALLLLENQADRKLRDEEGAKATKLARLAGHKETKKTIRQYKPPKEERAAPFRSLLRKMKLLAPVQDPEDPEEPEDLVPDGPAPEVEASAAETEAEGAETQGEAADTP